MVQFKRVNLRLTSEAHAKLEKWCADHGCTKQGKLAVMVDELTERMPLPPVGVSPAAATVRVEPVVPTLTADEAQRHFFGLLWEPHFAWIPDAIELTRALCEERGVLDWVPQLPSATWLDTKYRPRALAHNRDPDADIAAAGGSNG